MGNEVTTTPPDITITLFFLYVRVTNLEEFSSRPYSSPFHLAQEARQRVLWITSHSAHTGLIVAEVCIAVLAHCSLL